MRCNQRLMPPFRAQRREMLRNAPERLTVNRSGALRSISRRCAPERLTVKRVGRAVVNVPTQH